MGADAGGGACAGFVQEIICENAVNRACDRRTGDVIGPGLDQGLYSFAEGANHARLSRRRWQRPFFDGFPLSPVLADGLSCGDCDRSRLGINPARFRALLVQLRPASRRADSRLQHAEKPSTRAHGTHRGYIALRQEGATFRMHGLA
jgi:hypothetical protein